MEPTLEEKVNVVIRSCPKHGLNYPRKQGNLTTDNYSVFIEWVKQAYKDSIELGQLTNIEIKGDVEGPISTNKGTTQEYSYWFEFNETIGSTRNHQNPIYTTKFEDTYNQPSDDNETPEEYLRETLNYLKQELEKKLPSTCNITTPPKKIIIQDNSVPNQGESLS